jgi:hypothetical protein
MKRHVFKWFSIALGKRYSEFTVSVFNKEVGIYYMNAIDVEDWEYHKPETMTQWWDQEGKYNGKSIGSEIFYSPE